MINNEFIEQLKANISIFDIISPHVEIKKNGVDYLGLCPFHVEKTPSFRVSPQKNLYHCFGCGSGGDSFEFLKNKLGVNYVEAIEHIAALQNLTVPKDDKFNYTILYNELDKLNDIFTTNLKDNQLFIDYLKSRGISGTIAKKFDIGVSNNIVSNNDIGILSQMSNRLTFPIKDNLGRVIAFSCRTIANEKPKYINSNNNVLFNKSTVLYGLYESRQAIKATGQVIVVEGAMDVIALHQYNICNVLATLGTACTIEQLNKLFSLAHEIVFCFDGDEAGKKAGNKVINHLLPLLKDNTLVKFIELPNELDADNFIRNNTVEAFNLLVKNSIPLSNKIVNNLIQDIDLSILENRAKILNEANIIIDKLPNNFFKKELNKCILRLVEFNNEANIPPHNLVAENAILSALLQDNTIFDDISNIINANDFYKRENSIIYATIYEMLQLNKPVDKITILNSIKNLDTVGGTEYINTLNNNLTTNCVEYANIIAELSAKRNLLNASMQINKKIFNSQGIPAKELIDFAEQKIFSINDFESNKDFITPLKVLETIIDKLDKLKLDKSLLPFIASGFDELDKLTCGLESGLIVVAGRPSMGKTAFAMNIAENIIINQQLPTVIFSIEMTGEQLINRLIASIGSINMHNLRTGNLNAQEFEQMMKSVNRIKLLNDKLLINESCNLSTFDVKGGVRRAIKKYGKLGVVIIDYLQIMQRSYAETQALAIGDITRELKTLSKEINTPIILLSQLNRELERRENKRPVMSDLRESGAIEQDADLILFLYRDEVYNTESQAKGTAEIIIGKQRNGQIGTVKLGFQGKYSKFTNIG